MVAQAIIASHGDVDRFQKSLAWRFRFWLLGLPAGIGFATLRSILKLWIGFSANNSGVFSAGNGPAMRSAIIGIAINDFQLMREYVRASTRLTHTDPKAQYGALSIALAARMAAESETPDPVEYLNNLRLLIGDEGQELISLLDQAHQMSITNASVQAFANELGLDRKVSGYVYHSVPIVIYAWFRYPTDYQAAVESVVGCGGDTDTTAAMIGGIVGAAVGIEGIPDAWVKGIAEFPRSVSWMTRLANRLKLSQSGNVGIKPMPLQFWILIPRNLLFLIVVLLHGFRRLLPPY